MMKKNRKERIRAFWELVYSDCLTGTEYLAAFHLKILRRELAIVEEHIKYSGKAHKYLPTVISMGGKLEGAIQFIKDQIAYRTILGEYNGDKSKENS